MRYRTLLASVCGVLLIGAAWIGSRTRGDRPAAQAWKEVAPGILRSPSAPFGHALVSDGHLLLIDAPHPPEDAGKGVELVLLTHHHRDTCAFAADHLKAKVPVRAAVAAAPWLTADGVTKYWRESLPLRSSRTAYLVPAEGLAGVDCTLKDGDVLNWREWIIDVIATPGHTQDHLAFAVRKKNAVEGTIVTGDAFASEGKLWTPYTTDWDHWTDVGLKPTAESLRKLADRKPTLLLPAHGDVVKGDCAGVLKKTAEAVEDVAFLKSFERYTKKRLGDEPKYRFLAKEQAESNGSKPWTRVSEHLWITGNTYVLVSRDGPCLIFDPWDPHSAKQIPKLKADEKLGATEVVLFSHAHYDHYDGIHSLLEREKPKVWTLDQVAIPLVDPFLLRAPFLDVRPIKFDRLFKEGETATWREYKLKFHFLPGQTLYTMGVETTIDGKHCLFTADNWFHQDQFSGSGGWMGLNRSHPLGYAASAKKVLAVKPEWVLAEHGGPFEFNAEDFRRRVEWGNAGAKAADALCVSGSLLHDWDPHRVRIEPILFKAKPGATLTGALHVADPLKRKGKMSVTLEGRGIVPDETWRIDLTGEAVKKELKLKLPEKLAPGRYVFVLKVMDGEGVDGSDAFVVVEVE